MNGAHDMGGMHGFGPVEVEKDEPVFHEEWEARTYAMNRAIGAWRKWTIDASRYEIELIPPAEYLRMSYYEKWFVRLLGRLVKAGLVTPAELETGQPTPGSAKLTPPLRAGQVPGIALNREIPAHEDPEIRPLFEAGQRVRARDINPLGHTRLPRYARGRVGTIDRDHGVYNFPDTAAHGLGLKRQHVYSVRFASRDLWGDEASPHDFIYIDLWDDYLEPA